MLIVPISPIHALSKYEKTIKTGIKKYKILGSSHKKTLLKVKAIKIERVKKVPLKPNFVAAKTVICCCKCLNLCSNYLFSNFVHFPFVLLYQMVHDFKKNGLIGQKHLKCTMFYFPNFPAKHLNFTPKK